MQPQNPNPHNNDQPVNNPRKTPGQPDRDNQGQKPHHDDQKRGQGQDTERR